MASKTANNIKEKKAENKRKKKNAKRQSRRNSKGLQDRILDKRDMYVRLLIVCEGAKTEPLYFEQFPVRSSHIVRISGEGRNTLSLVKRTIELRDKDKEEYDEVWAVFDRDSFSPQQFNDALSLARCEKIKVAWSNEAFELWYLMHFEFCASNLSRTTYSKRLSKHLGKHYRKADPDMYTILLSKQSFAISNAVTLSEQSNLPPEKCNPGTTVHELVERLNQLTRK